MQQLQSGMQALQSGNLDTAENIFRNILSLDSSEVHSLESVVFDLGAFIRFDFISLELVEDLEVIY